jgi:CheY-like chemotaxis protein
MDTGVGMDAATMARLFEPFFTTKGPGKGSGLGLATVYGIVEQCGGFIQVDSEFGRGATFAVYLPRADEEAELVPDADELDETGSLHGTESVIVAEDDDSVRSLMAGVLRTAGYSVSECPGALEAVATAEAMHHPLALLVTDVVMPDGDGPDLAARVLAAHPGARVLFVTGHPDETIGAYGIPRDDVEVLRKPFVPDAFLRRVRDALDAPRRPIPVRAA